MDPATGSQAGDEYALRSDYILDSGPYVLEEDSIRELKFYLVQSMDDAKT